jgi:hypothetical protein
MAFENDPDGRSIAERYAGVDFDKPKTVWHETFCEYGTTEWSVSEFREQIASAIDIIPKKYLASARVDLDGGYDESTKLVISYEAPESDETVADRVRRCEQYVAESREKDRQTYERLKRKFG